MDAHVTQGNSDCNLVQQFDSRNESNLPVSRFLNYLVLVHWYPLHSYPKVKMGRASLLPHEIAITNTLGVPLYNYK